MMDDLLIEMESEVDRRFAKTEPEKPRKRFALEYAKIELKCAYNWPFAISETAREYWLDCGDDIMEHIHEPEMSRKRRREVLGFDCNADVWYELRLIAYNGYDEAQRIIVDRRNAAIEQAIRLLKEAQEMPDDDPEVVRKYDEWSCRLNCALYRVQSQFGG